MKVAILSDTHGLLRPEVAEHLKTADAILHAGDINTQAIVDQMAAAAPLQRKSPKHATTETSAKTPNTILRAKSRGLSRAVLLKSKIFC